MAGWWGLRFTGEECTHLHSPEQTTFMYHMNNHTALSPYNTKALTQSSRQTLDICRSWCLPAHQLVHAWSLLATKKLWFWVGFTSRIRHIKLLEHKLLVTLYHCLLCFDWQLFIQNHVSRISLCSGIWVILLNLGIYNIKDHMWVRCLSSCYSQ